MRKFIFLFLLLLTALPAAMAQVLTPHLPDVEMDSKWYVVLTVCLLILGGLFFYLFFLERRIREMENNDK
ncbi:MAG TPA: hypothetical protein PKE07_10010 [Lacibacter sp.]|nr:hypothetical protein [Lacibacter sp.]HMO89522.1 hypothetical protein [Lacibacter sp.]